MNGHNVRTSSTPAAATSLRPRAKRLISGLSDDGESAVEFASTSPAPSPFASRSASPIPSAHPQRAASSNHAAQKFTGSSWGRRAQLQAQRKGVAESPTSPSSLAGFWGTSWTTLQGIASDFLGNELEASNQVKAGQKRATGKLYSQRSASTSVGRGEWGPSGAPTSAPATSDIGTGTKQEREAALRAQKRKDMLTRQDSSYADALGKFKRRLSDDHESMSAPPSESDDRAALVYLHHVDKDDTLAGITIKYNCSANVLRKANRMWPNDTVQSRQTLVLPVDACGVKGRPVTEPSALDLLSTESDALAAGDAEEVPTPTQAQPPAQTFLTNGDTGRARTDSTSTATTSRRASSSAADGGDPPWHHDSWVLLPNTSKPTEIARLSRRALGYFPPARRKSNTHSDFNTPSTSLDLTRTATANNDFRRESLDQRRTQSPQRPRRSRRPSNADTGYYPSHLSGPGGVGTMNRNVHFPGPAQDGLNKMFAKHLPDVAPPKHQTDLYQPDLPMYSDDFTPTHSGAVTPAERHATNMNFENVGGAIEGWVRRLAKSAMTPAESQASRKAARASVGTAGKGAGDIGDLIEMTDEFEIGADEEDEVEDDARGRPKSAIHVGARPMPMLSPKPQPQRGQPGGSGSGREYFGGVKRSVSGRKAGKDD